MKGHFSVFFGLLTILAATWAVIEHRVNKRIEVVSQKLEGHISKPPAVFKDGRIFYHSRPWELDSVTTATAPSSGDVGSVQSQSSRALVTPEGMIIATVVVASSGSQEVAIPMIRYYDCFGQDRGSNFTSVAAAEKWLTGNLKCSAKWTEWTEVAK